MLAQPLVDPAHARSGMNQRTLGRSGLRVSEIGMGCSGFWGSRAFAEREAAAVIAAALDRGVTLFDTGHNYSGFNAEPRLGRILRALLGPRDRNRVVISTKAGTLAPGGSPVPARWRRRQKDFSPDFIEQSCAHSIRNLGCEYLDIFQLHDISPDQLGAPLLERLQEMRNKGMYRHLGVYAHHAAQIDFVAANPLLFDVILLDYNALLPARDAQIVALHAGGVGVLAGTVLGQGQLVHGAVRVPRRLADAWNLARTLLKPEARRRARRSKPVRELLSAIDGVSPAQAALAGALDNQRIASCLVGTTSTQHLRELLAAAGCRIDPALRTAIANATSR